MKRCVGLTPWVMLFFTVFCGNYSWAAIVAWMGTTLHSGFQGGAIGIVIALGINAGFLPIIYYRMRKRFPIRCVAFFAATVGMLLGAMPLCRKYFTLPESQEPFLTGVLVVLLLLISLGQMELLVARARYPYSGKSDQWLRCHATEKRAVPEPGKPIPSSFEEILAMNSAGKTWRELFFRTKNHIPLFLFLDPDPDGERYLFCIFQAKKQAFFTLQLPRLNAVPLTLPATEAQLKQLRDRFGDFKKFSSTRLFAPLAGEEIRKLQRQLCSAVE